MTNTIKGASEELARRAGDMGESSLVAALEEIAELSFRPATPIQALDAINDASRKALSSPPPAVTSQSVGREADLRGALRKLLDRDMRNTCQHDETHRGGFLWEICDSCGAKWADDEGGKPEWTDPPEWAAAIAALAEPASPPPLGTTQDDIGQGNRDCLAKRRPGEPMFILLGRDPDAHNIVRMWALRRLAAGDTSDHPASVLALSDEMRRYAADPANAPASAPPASDYPASPPPVGEQGAVAWIISNGKDDRWRAWEHGYPVWVDDPAKATRYARREDAEAVHYHDEDAWHVKPYPTTTERGRG